MTKLKTYPVTFKGNARGTRGIRLSNSAISPFIGYNPAATAQVQGVRGRFAQLSVEEPNYTTRLRNKLLRRAGIRTKMGPNAQ
jgi:hypothetical protein